MLILSGRMDNIYFILNRKNVYYLFLYIYTVYHKTNKVKSKIKQKVKQKAKQIKTKKA